MLLRLSCLSSSLLPGFAQDAAASIPAGGDWAARQLGIEPAPRQARHSASLTSGGGAVSHTRTAKRTAGVLFRGRFEALTIRALVAFSVERDSNRTGRLSVERDSRWNDRTTPQRNSNLHLREIPIAAC